MSESTARKAKILLIACGIGAMSGLFGVRGGILLVPLLVLLFGFEQHRAQGTSLLALVPPTSFLAFLAYYRAHEVNLKIGLLLIPGVFVGGLCGAALAQRLSPRRMCRICAAFLFLLGLWQALGIWRR